MWVIINDVYLGVNFTMGGALINGFMISEINLGKYLIFTVNVEDNIIMWDQSLKV